MQKSASRGRLLWLPITSTRNSDTIMLAFQLNSSPISIPDTAEGETSQKVDIVLIYLLYKSISMDRKLKQLKYAYFI